MHEKIDNTIPMDFVQKYCRQTTRELLELAQTFARKSRRLPAHMTCTDLINAFDCMNILYQQRTIYEKR